MKRPYCIGDGRVGDFAGDLILLAVVGIGAYVLYKKVGAWFTPSNQSTSPQAQPGANPTSPGAEPVEATTATSIATQAAVSQAVNPFYPNLYKANPGDASIDANTANNLWATLQTNQTNENDPASAQWGGNSNFTATMIAFQSVVGNQTDISRVASVVEANAQTDLLTWIQQNYTAADDGPIQLFITWVNSLPVN